MTGVIYTLYYYYPKFGGHAPSILVSCLVGFMWPPKEEASEGLALLLVMALLDFQVSP